MKQHPFSPKMLENIFKRKNSQSNILRTRESNTVEFKENFNWGSKSKYAKTMAAYANREGGYIVFGIKDLPHEIVGLANERFEVLDEEKITLYLNEALSPEINWEKIMIDVDGKKIGLLYTYESKGKPVICTKNDDELKEAEIYYRYRARSEKIKFPELRKLIDSEIDKEKLLWMRYMERISKTGIDNIALLDTTNGKLEGKSGTIFIDEQLLKSIEFIKEGEFNEKTGAKTLKLIGEVKEISGSTVLPSRTRMKGIHTREIYEALLKGKLHENTSAREYLEHLPHEPSKILPFYFFKQMGGLKNDELERIFKAVQTTRSSNKQKLIKRITTDDTYKKVGQLDEPTIKSGLVFSDLNDFELYLEKNSNNKSIRKSLILNLLNSDNRNNVYGFLDEYTVEILEAITHLEKEILLEFRDFFADLLLEIYDEKFSEVASHYRNTICFIDEILYKQKQT